jgi:hypothetical protein
MVYQASSQEMHTIKQETFGLQSIECDQRGVMWVAKRKAPGKRETRGLQKEVMTEQWRTSCLVESRVAYSLHPPSHEIRYFARIMPVMPSCNFNRLAFAGGCPEL